MKILSFVFIAILLLVVSLGNACVSQEAKEPPDQVSVQLKWLHSAQFAGMYVADQKGFYAEENITITLNSGGQQIDEFEHVTSGQDDFGIVTAAEVLHGGVQDAPIKAIAVVFRINPAVYFSLERSGIEKPQDFVGKRVMQGSADFILPAMMDKLGIDMDQLQMVSPSLGIQAFLDGKVDVWLGYMTNQVVRLRSQGYKLNLIRPDDYGIHFYNDLIITTDTLIEENPGLVERFLRATLRGWRYAIENPDEAVALLSQYDETLDMTHERAAMEAQVPLIHTGRDEIGWMQDDIWQEMHDMLLGQGTLDKPVDLDKVYTMDFLYRVYGDQ